MKALSLKQPWAWLVVNGLKDIENRPWRTKYRGPVLIHASKTFDESFYSLLDAWRSGTREPAPSPDELKSILETLPRSRSGFPMGGIVGQVEITGCVDSHPSFWFMGPHAFTLNNAQTLPFAPCRGKLNFFTPAFNQEAP